MNLKMNLIFILVIIQISLCSCAVKSNGYYPSYLIAEKLEKAVYTSSGVVKKIDDAFFIIDRKNEIILMGADMNPYIDKRVEVMGELYRGKYKGTKMRVINVKEVRLSVQGIQ